MSLPTFLLCQLKNTCLEICFTVRTSACFNLVFHKWCRACVHICLWMCTVQIDIQSGTSHVTNLTRQLDKKY